MASYTFDTRVLPGGRAQPPDSPAGPGQPRCHPQFPTYLDIATQSGSSALSLNQAILDEDPAGGAYLVGSPFSSTDDLPVFVNFGRWNCGLADFFGKRVADNVDVNADTATANTTAHEIGHVLLGPAHPSGADRLMREGAGSRQATRITPEECASARGSAQRFHDQYVRLLERLGRRLPPPAPPAGPPAGPPDPSGPFHADETCCRLDQGEVQRMPIALCALAGGTGLPEAQCRECCVVSDAPPAAGLLPPGQCASPLPATHCDTVCCGDSATKVSRYECAESGETDVPCPAQCRLPPHGEAFAGYHTTFLRLDDGRVFAAGDDVRGQLGTGLATAMTAPREAASLHGALAIASGMDHSLALHEDGVVVSAGANAHGQLGDGTTTARSEPAVVEGLPPVVAIAAGEDHSLAIDALGRVWAWGRGVHGQLGTGSTLDQASPVVVLGAVEDGVPIGDFSDRAVAVAAGGRHSLALLESGRVLAWGANDSGQLALRADGMVVAWGEGSYGQLGTGSQEDEPFPVTTEFAEATAIAAGGAQTFAVTEGHVQAAGLVAGATGTTTSPVLSLVPFLVEDPCDPSGMLSGVERVTAGAHHALASPGLVSWGDGTLGQLGGFTGDVRTTAASIVLDGPPACELVTASPATLWPPNGKLEEVRVEGAVAADGGPVALEVTRVVQDEPRGAEPDAVVLPDGVVRVRRKRQGAGDGRIYTIDFVATDGGGASCTGSVHVCVPHDQGGGARCGHDGRTFASAE